MSVYRYIGMDVCRYRFWDAYFSAIYWILCMYIYRERDVCNDMFMCRRIYVYVQVCVHILMFVFMGIGICRCFITSSDIHNIFWYSVLCNWYIYIYIYIHTYTYAYTHVFLERARGEPDVARGLTFARNPRISIQVSNLLCFGTCFSQAANTIFIWPASVFLLLPLLETVPKAPFGACLNDILRNLQDFEPSNKTSNRKTSKEEQNNLCNRR